MSVSVKQAIIELQKLAFSGKGAMILCARDPQSPFQFEVRELRAEGPSEEYPDGCVVMTSPDPDPCAV